MFIDKLQAAIPLSYAGATALVSATPGGLNYDIAPSGDEKPFIIYEQPDGPLTDTYGNHLSADVMTIFRVIGNGNTATGAIMSLLVAHFDNTTLTLVGGINYSMYRINEPVSIRLPDDQHGADTWQWSVAYSYSIQ